jgi:protein TonB
MRADAGMAMRLLRQLVTLLLASGAALALGWFMYFLTHSEDMQLNDSARIQMLDFVRLRRDQAVERKDRKPERPDPQEIPDAPPAENSDTSGDTTLAVTAPNLGLGIDIGRGGIGLGTGDGEYLPIVKVAPVYPRRALERGITGECLVTYTVTTSGTVRDVSVVEGQCPESIFERPSIDAALRFRYKPRVIDGEPVEVIGVYNRFFYEQEVQ